jgi:hypothetical protein
MKTNQSNSARFLGITGCHAGRASQYDGAPCAVLPISGGRMSAGADALEIATGMEEGSDPERHAYLEGRWARAMNQKADDNPHRQGTPERAQWLLGWAAANYLYWWNTQLAEKRTALPPPAPFGMYYSFQKYRLRRNVEEIQYLAQEIQKNRNDLEQTLKKLTDQYQNRKGWFG